MGCAWSYAGIDGVLLADPAATEERVCGALTEAGAIITSCKRTAVKDGYRITLTVTRGECSAILKVTITPDTGWAVVDLTNIHLAALAEAIADALYARPYHVPYVVEELFT